MSATIRDYDPERDAAAIRACFVELQDDEHAMSPTSPPAEAIADDYLAWMHERVDACDGRIWVAEDGADGVIGFVTVLAHVPRSDPDDGDPHHAVVSELTLRAGHRHRGLGAELLRVAETWARERGAPSVRIAHHGRNEAAHRFYEREGYRTLVVVVEKRLG